MSPGTFCPTCLRGAHIGECSTVVPEYRAVDEFDRARPWAQRLAPGQAVAVDWTAERYHGDEATSRGKLVTLDENPSLYYALHEVRTLAPDPSTKAMRLGTNVHLAVLEPDEWQRRKYFAKPKRPYGCDKTAPIGDPRSNAWHRWQRNIQFWETCKEGRTDLIELDPDEMQTIDSMTWAVRSHEFAGKELLAAPGRSEQTVIWHHPPLEYEVDGEQLTDSLVIRIRADRLCELDETVMVVLDLKTARAPEPERFGYEIADRRYLLQAALYTDAVRALYPDREVHFVFVVVRSSPPYECACYSLTDEDLDEGRNQYRAAMINLLKRRRTNDWLADWQKSCHTIKLPRRAYKTYP